MSFRFYLGLVTMFLAFANGNSKLCGALIAHFDPNVITTLFQDGNTTGGTIAVTALGQSVGWMTDVQSPTSGGAALDFFIDIQQASATVKPTLVSGPDGSILSFDGNDNLLGFDADLGMIDGVLGSMDTNTATLIVVGQANASGSGIGTFFDMRHGTTSAGDGAFGLQYDYNTNQLQGLVRGAAVASTPLPVDRLFVATLAWDGPNSSASLKVSVLGNSETTISAASGDAMDHTRFRLGASANATRQLNGLIGDVLLYNDVADYRDIHRQLVAAYGVPEPTGLAMIVCMTLAILVSPRWAHRHT